MPDTMIQTDAAPAPVPASCGVMSGYRSASIGKLVAARAKASSKIKAIVKDKRAKIESRKEGGRAYEYAYADLAGVFDAIEEAISEVGLAILQTTQDRGREGTYLLTTLAHESDQWIASEIRLKSADAGPQVYGSEMTYLRRYAVLAALALAPESDDDGKAAQDRADQQARQRPVQRPAQSPAISKDHETREPVHVPIQTPGGEKEVKAWLSQVRSTLDPRPLPWRQKWLEIHQDEIEQVRVRWNDVADRIVAAANEPDDEEAAE